MDQLIHPLYNHHIQNVIKSFSASASRSLRGPSGYMSSWGADAERSDIKMSAEDFEEYKRALVIALKNGAGETSLPGLDPLAPVEPIQIRPMPIFIPMDTCYSGLTDTLLEGEKIACFEIGGEKRLCLPQILNTVLKKFTMEDVHEATSTLNVFFSRCSAHQLALLKSAKVLPASAQSCGLITKTDAERLSNKLLHVNSAPADFIPRFSTNSFKVYHECFGKCKGVFDPELYASEDSLCIQCCECSRLFSPQKFVCHSHKAMENRVCHWGFDSNNWRSYLLLAKDQGHLQAIVKCLEEVKGRFCKSSRKRKQKIECVVGDKRQPVKEENESLPSDLNQNPPVVLNPEKIVPFSGHDRYGRDFVPNVSLAPVSVAKKPRRDSVSGSDPEPTAADDEHDISIDVDVSSVDSDSEDGVDIPASPASLDPRQTLESLREGREREWTLVQRALSGEVGTDKESKEAFVQEYIESRNTEQRLVHNLTDAKISLQKELEREREKRRTVVEEAQEWRQAAESERQEAERMREQLAEMRELLAHQLKQQREKFGSETEELQARLAQEQQLQAQMSQELAYLRQLNGASPTAPLTPVSPKANTAMLATALHSPTVKLENKP